MNSFLITIILACQVPNGTNAFEFITEKHKSCQKELIRCYQKRKTNTKTTDEALTECLLER